MLINVPKRKMSGNLFNDPHINKCPYEKSLEAYLMFLVSMCPYKKVWKLI